MIFTKEQKAVIEAREDKVVVLAAAASGKTQILTERIKFLLDKKVTVPERIVMITFTNAAAEVMRQRLGEYGKNMYLGTIHGYCNYLLRNHGIDTSHFLNEERFDELFEEMQKYPEAILPVDYLLLDEAQDSTSLEFQFLLEMIDPLQFMLVGDLRQCIYEWRGSSPQILYNISKRPDVKVYDLLNNFRNGSAILTYAKQFVDRLGPRYEDRSVSQTGIAGSVKEMGEINLKTISRLIKETPEYGKWFVLVRTNTQIDMVMNYLKGSYIPCTTFKRAEMTLEELSSCLNENTVKILTVHSAKGLENDYVIVYGCNPYGGEESRICYVAATRARKRLYWIKTNKPKKNRNDGLTMWG